MEKRDIFNARSKVIASVKIAPIKFHSKEPLNGNKLHGGD